MATVTLGQKEEAATKAVYGYADDDPSAGPLGKAEAVWPSPPAPRPREPEEVANAAKDSTEGVGRPGDDEEQFGRLIRRPLKAGPRRRFEVLQQFEGVVSEVAEDAFWADVYDLTEPSRPREVHELPLREIPQADRDLLVPGGVFYWCIGYERSPGGQIRRVSEMRLRRTPKWSAHTLERAKSRAADLLAKLSGNAEDRAATNR